VAGLAIGLVTMWASVKLSLGELANPGAGLWPFLIGIVLTGSCAFFLLTRDDGAAEPFSRKATYVAAGVLSLAGFVSAFEAMGFVIPCVVLLVLWLRFLGGEPWRLSIVIAALGTVVFYLVFVVVLSIPVPDMPDILRIG